MIYTKKRYLQDKKNTATAIIAVAAVNAVSTMVLAVGQKKLKSSLTKEVTLAASKANAAMMESAKLSTDFAQYRASIVKMSKGKSSGLKVSELKSLERMKMGD